MDDESFRLENYYEIRVTHKMMMEARFCPDPIDLEVPVSPVAAALHDRIIKKLIALEIENEGESAQAKWDEWLDISPDYREWAVSVDRAKRDSRWLEWNDTERRFYAMTLLSPFNVPEHRISEFLGEVQSHHVQSSENI